MSEPQGESDKLKEAALKALADPQDDRTAAEMERDLGLAEGAIAAWMRDDALFRRRLGQLQAAVNQLEVISVTKSLAAKAKEGSIQHQKFYLERLDKPRKKTGERLVVEFIVTEAPKRS